jgi:[acyl-carrier-protein] S-malonyltransferase
MAAIIGLSFAEVDAITKQVANEDFVCQAANDNADGQTVISGHKEAVEAAMALANEKGAKRALLLPVSAPFHCALMEPAAKEMAEALAQIDIHAPALPCIANVTAKPENEPDTIRNLLVEQMTGRVRWRESVHTLANLGVERAVELGTGKVLCGLIKRTDKTITTMNAETPKDIEALLEVLT